MLPELKKDETGRVKALERLDVLDTSEEKPFENIVSLVQQVLKVPICAVSLVDQDRQWFKARRGLDVCETERDISFCTHAIQSEEALVVKDAALDSRFSTNPLVTGDPHIRSYAGIPLRTPDGYNVGTLCAIDRIPREFPQVEIEILTNFARVITDELELRQIATTDVLTGALSRRAWTERANLELQRTKCYGRPLSIMIIDIDHFKSINDTLGHSVGDIVIQRITKLAMDTIRETDAFGRYGGEEFVVLLPETALTTAMTLADRIRIKCFEETIKELGGLHTSVSIGLTDMHGSEDNVVSMIERADQALYIAKNSGRNRCMEYRSLPEEIERVVA